MPSSPTSPKTSRAGAIVIALGILGFLGQLADALQGKSLTIQNVIPAAVSVLAGKGLLAAADDAKKDTDDKEK